MAGGALTSVARPGTSCPPTSGSCWWRGWLWVSVKPPLFSGTLRGVLAATGQSRAGRVAGWSGLSMRDSPVHHAEVS